MRVAAKPLDCRIVVLSELYGHLVGFFHSLVRWIALLSLILNLDELVKL